MNKKLLFLGVFSFFLLSGFSSSDTDPTASSDTTSPFPVPMEAMQSQNQVSSTDSILSSLDNLDLTQTVNLAQEVLAGDSTSPNQDSFTLPVQEGITTSTTTEDENTNSVSPTKDPFALPAQEQPTVTTNSVTTNSNVQDPFALPTQVQKGLDDYVAKLQAQEQEKIRQQQIIQEAEQQMRQEEQRRLLAQQEQIRQQQLAKQRAQQQSQLKLQIQQQQSQSQSNGTAVAVSSDIKSIVNQMSAKYSVPREWILAVIDKESGFNPNAVGHNTNGTLDRGLMQLNSSTAPTLARRLGWTYTSGMEFDPAKNVEMGTMYLAYLMQKSTDPDFVFTSYNRGEGGSQRLFNQQGSYQSTYSVGVKQRIPKYKSS